MKEVSWRNIAELIGIAAIVASLIFVGLQMRQTQTLAAGEAFAITGATRVSVDQAIIDNADVWVRGSSGEQLDEAEALVFNMLVSSEETWYFTSYMQSLAAGSSAEGNDLVLEFANLLLENPGAGRAFLANADSGAEFRSARGAEGADYVRFVGLVRRELDMLGESLN